MLLYWIWFAELKKLSLSVKQRLLEHFRDPEEIYHCRSAALLQIEGVTEGVIEALENKDLSEAQKILNECVDRGIGILTCADESYPARLRVTYDAPLVLYFRGTLPDWDSLPVIGIVGTRKASSYGLKTAGDFGKEIAACGALVVSGGAAGIDTMAMEGALSAGAATVGVLGCGVDVVYPKSNRKFFSRVLEKGCLISEYPPRTEPLHWHFPARNRIISGMSNGLLVVEAPEKSGALNTARHALEQGRDVFAVPGNIGVETCAGSNALLREGASAVLSGWDVVKEYEAQYPGKIHRARVSTGQIPMPRVAQEPMIPANSERKPIAKEKKSIDNPENSTYSVLNSTLAALSETERAVLALVSREGSLTDEIIARSGLSAGTVKSVLTKLTLKKLIQNLPGGRVSLK